MEQETWSPATLPEIPFEEIRDLSVRLDRLSTKVAEASQSGPPSRSSDLGRLSEVLQAAHESLYRIANVADAYLDLDEAREILRGGWFEPREEAPGGRRGE